MDAEDVILYFLCVVLIVVGVVFGTVAHFEEQENKRYERCLDESRMQWVNGNCVAK